MITFTKNFFPNKVTYTGTGGKKLDISFVGAGIQPIGREKNVLFQKDSVNMSNIFELSLVIFVIYLIFTPFHDVWDNLSASF